MFYSPSTIDLSMSFEVAGHGRIFELCTCSLPVLPYSTSNLYNWNIERPDPFESLLGTL